MLLTCRPPHDEARLHAVCSGVITLSCLSPNRRDETVWIKHCCCLQTCQSKQKLTHTHTLNVNDELPQGTLFITSHTFDCLPENVHHCGDSEVWKEDKLTLLPGYSLLQVY